ncbi:hypothetical protein AB0J21_12505 [Streptomyces sp. NPDC049954]|uniref:hypothetical protein n=1 Tax=Streptomyces sp. NPDC049954 TaxID=3155779 RepID=UPI003436507A
MSALPPTLPPAPLHPEAELARAALTAPVLARAVRLARWAGPHVRVGAGGELVDEQLPEAAKELDLSGEDAAADASEAWRVAVDTGLVEVTDPPEEASGEPEGDEDGPYGSAAPGAELATIASGGPRDVLTLWLGALDTIVSDASVPDLDDLEELTEALEGGGTVDFDALGWDPEGESEFLDEALITLYLLTVSEGGSTGTPLPLPALAASMIVPDDMGEPTDDILEQVSETMMRLDVKFRILEPVGLVAYEPLDEALLVEADPAEPVEPEEEDVSRYGLVRLTPLGLYGMRTRLLENGVDAPAVGDLADKDAATLLAATARYPQDAVRAELEQWLAGRAAGAAARELLAAARGGDADGPLRRLRAQEALQLVGAEAESEVRAVLDDPELGGLARVWLSERGTPDVPPPSEDMVFWLTVDTVAAQLAVEGNSEELQALVEGLAAQHSGFFDAAWRVEHPATADVLEAMGRLHPDKKIAKEARKAAFKARSQQQG